MRASDWVVDTLRRHDPSQRCSSAFGDAFSGRADTDTQIDKIYDLCLGRLVDMPRCVMFRENRYRSHTN
jgi:hypothetical protein